jgi:hypothetical protein
MINDEATTHEKQGTVGVQVEPLVERSRSRGRKTHHLN